MEKLFFTLNFVILVFFIVNLQAQNAVKESIDPFESKIVVKNNPFYLAKYEHIDEDSVISLFSQQPNFDLYKDNYFISGIPLNTKITKNTADAKYQISFRHRITKNLLPFKTSLMLSYSQKSFWGVFKNSSPFNENNYNPSFILLKFITAKHQLRGLSVLAFEHESNGRDSIYSRSWNYLSLSMVYFYNKNITLQCKAWLGWLSPENEELYNYKGYGFVALNYKSLNDKLWISTLINPSRKLSNVNSQIEISFKAFENLNQYFFIQWYQGYSENLINYNRYSNMIRLGICIKPAVRSFY